MMFYTGTCDIYRATVDNAPYAAASYIRIAAGIPCHIWRLSARERYELTTAVVVFFLPASTDVTVRDRIYYESRWFDVESVKNPGNRDHHLQCECKEVQ